MRVIFLGTPYLASEALNALIQSRHEVIAVVTQPDKASGRGMTTKYSPVKELALAHDIPLFQPKSIKDKEALDLLEAMNPDIFVVTAYAQKLPERLLDMAPHGCINIHPSLLPKYRGAAPLRGPILNGDPYTGITIMNVVYEFDSGDILKQEKLEMDPKETVRTLTPKVAKKGASMLVSVVDAIEDGTAVATPQDEAEHTYIKQLSKSAGMIHFSDPAICIERQIRACDPWPSAYTDLDGKTFKIWDADVIEDEASAAQHHLDFTQISEDAEIGSVAYVDKKHLVIRCGAGFLSLNEVQLEGKKRMAIDEFLRGKKIEKGHLFPELQPEQAG